MDDEEFFRRVEAARDAGESDTSLAGRLGIDVRTYHSWVAGEHRPSPAKKDQALDRLRTAPPKSTRAASTPSVPREDPVMSSSESPLRAVIKTYADTLPEHELVRAVTYLEGLRRGLPADTHDRGVG